MDFRQRLEHSRVHLVGAQPDPDAEMVSVYYACERGNSPACLDLRLPNGCRKSFPYSYVSSIGFDPDAGIEILTAQRRILITGRNLTALYDNLISYRVRYIQADVGGDVQEDGLFVQAIEIEESGF